MMYVYTWIEDVFKTKLHSFQSISVHVGKYFCLMKRDSCFTLIEWKTKLHLASKQERIWIFRGFLYYIMKEKFWVNFFIKTVKTARYTSRESFMKENPRN